MRRVVKGIPLWLIMLLSAIPLAAALYYPWIVAQGPVADVSIAINKAEASWEPIQILVGPIDSGESFSQMEEVTLTIANARMLQATFNVITVTDEEKSFFDTLDVTIGEDTDNDGKVDVEHGTIMLADPRPSPVVTELGKGDHRMIIIINGLVAYPPVQNPVVDFQLVATVEPPPP